MSSQKKKVQCSRFEPQAWRKTLCKNCFKTKVEHTDGAGMEDSQVTSDYASDGGASSPEVVAAAGDKILIRRNLKTPPPECQTGDFVGLGSRRGSDGIGWGGGGGRRTPTTDDRSRSVSVEKTVDGGFRNEGTTTTNEDVNAISSGSVAPPPPTPGASRPPPVNGGQREPPFRPPAEQQQPPSTNEPERSSVRDANDERGGSTRGTNPSLEISQICPSPSPFSPSSEEKKKKEEKEEEEVAKVLDGDVAPVGDEASPRGGGRDAVGGEAGDLGTDKTDKKTEIELGINRTEATDGASASSPTSNGEQQDQSWTVGSEGRGATLDHQSNGNEPESPPAARDSGTESAHECTQYSAAAAAVAADAKSRPQSLVDEREALNGNCESNTSSSSSSQGQPMDADTKIAHEAAEPPSGGSSYVQSLRINLLSPVSPVNAEEWSAPVGAKESRNSYGERHGDESPAQAAAAAAAAADAAAAVAAGERVLSGGRQPQSAEVDRTAGAFASGATAPITQFQLLQDPAISGDLSSSADSRQHGDRATGLTTSSDRSGVESSKSCPSSPAPPPGSPVGPEDAGVRLAFESVAPSCETLANNSCQQQQRALLSAPGYQYVDANDSRICYNDVGDGIGGGGGGKADEENLYYLRDEGGGGGGRDKPGSGAVRQESSSAERRSGESDLSPDEPPRRKVTSLFHHVPGEGNDGQPCAPTAAGDSVQFRNQPDSSYDNNNICNVQQQQQQQHPGEGRRRRRSRVISLEDDFGPRSMNAFDYRSDAMMEGTRMVMESLREKVCLLQEQLDRQEREKGALVDLLAAKKSDYEIMKDHYSGAIGSLEMETQRLKSEKSRLLDKLQLPESERASLAAEENEIAELKRRLEEYENRYTEVVGENEDLRQEVRDLQLEMEEMHDQFREEETIEFRELQKELENTAKNCRILQFKLRKSDRRIEQLESDRTQYEDKLRHYESCFQTSDDKRRIRVLEEDLRLAKESAVRLHAEVERAEDRRLKHQEELDRAKNSVNEADNKRLCLQNQLDSMKHEMGKLRDQLRFETRQDVIKPGIQKIGPAENDVAVAQLTKDLKDSLERENDLKEQLKFSEEENVTMRKKLLEMEEETESMSLQLRKLSSAKSGRYMKGKTGDVDNEPLTERENEIRLQMELAEQEVKVLKRKMDELQQDNDNLLCAIKYLRSKLEQQDGVRNATPIGDAKTTKELLTRIGAPGPSESGEAGCEVKDEVVEQLQACTKEVHCLKEKVSELEMENIRLVENCRKFHSAAEGSEEAKDKEKNLMTTIEELEQLLMQEKEKCLRVSNERETTELNLNQEKSLIAQELSLSKEALVKVTKELESMKKTFAQCKDEAQDWSISALKKTGRDMIAKVEGATKADASKTELEALQKIVSDLQLENDKLKEKEKSKSSLPGVKDKEPASWRWEKQELEKQAKEFKKKFEDLQAEMKKPTTKTKDVAKEDSKDMSKQLGENEQYKKQLEELKKNLNDAEELLKKKEKEKEKIEKELKEVMNKAAKDKANISETKDLFAKQKDDIAGEKKKLMKDLEMEKKRNEELTKEKERLTKEKDEMMSEQKKLIKERDAAIKDKEDLAKSKTGKEDDLSKKSTPFGLRSKVITADKPSDSAVSDAAKVKELMDALEKKEAELQTLRTKTDAKGPGDKLGFQAREASELRKEKEKTEKDLEKSLAEKKLLKNEIQDLKEKSKANDTAWLKEKAQLEQDLKQATEKSRSTTKSFRTSDDPKAVQEKEALIKEKLKLIEEVTKLKKELGEFGKQRNSDKEEFEKKLKEKNKSLDEIKANSNEFQKEIERLKAQVESANSASVPSKAITIPVQQDRSTKSIPIQKVSKLSSNSCDEQDPALIKADLIALEEAYRSRTKNLEEELSCLREQLSSVQKESRTQSQKSQKSFTELKTNFEKEYNSWNKERELFKKSGKLADENAAKVNKLDKTIEELNGKLKTEEAKRRELEVKLATQESSAKVDKAATPTEEKPKVPEEKTSTGQKASDFRNRFEKFGGTPRPVRKMSLPTSSTSLSDASEKSDWVGEIQKQMTEAEKARLKDREELLEKLEKQKKDFELKLEAFKETTKMLDAKSQDLSALEKKLVELHCQLEEERSSWGEERSKLQSKLTDAQKSGREDKDKIVELTGEVKKLQVLTSSGKSGTASLSGASSPLTPSNPLSTDKPSFKVKSQVSDSTQNSTTGPVTSIVIPIRKVDDVKKPTTEDTAQSSTPTSNGVGKLSKKLFPPFATDSTPNKSSSAKSNTPGQQTSSLINRINRSNPPKL